MEKVRTPVLSTVVGMMISPGAVLRYSLASIHWGFSLAVSTLAFGLFFAQTGIDLYRTGQQGLSFVLLSAGAGAAYGALMIPLLGVLVWLTLKVARTDKGLGWAVSSFCLSYSGALVYSTLGLLFSLLLGWRTAVAFGLTGVLWATGPLIASIREMTGGRTGMAVLLSTLVGAVVLTSWSYLGRM
ncbi:MAG: hypothetical protein QHH05_07735 [Syntrophomonadaceae bacterium]|jgi:hypothetical protein|nr:hypothetical protein [Syntrophomonadaceae bacterium]MDH7498312.1 hypothetical protein [Syntrophomonadaceae bacterium]